MFNKKKTLNIFIFKINIFEYSVQNILSVCLLLSSIYRIYKNKEKDQVCFMGLCCIRVITQIYRATENGLVNGKRLQNIHHL